FGGSLYSMSDPWLMLILIDALGKDFIVWDKAASIRFMRPGKSSVFGHFKISPEEIEQIRTKAIELGKYEPTFTVSLYDEEGQEIAQVDKVLWVKHKAK